MGKIEQAPAAVVFDLFGTLVGFDFSRLPTADIDGQRRYLTIDGLNELLARLSPEPDLETFFGALVHTSRKLAEETAHNHAETSSPQRFTRALAELGVADRRPQDGDIAVELATRHMAGLASAVVCPPGRIELLTRLRSRFRVGLVSNFDYQPTALSLLDEFGLAAHLETILISDGEGVRKPSSTIFHAAARRLEVKPHQCLYVGDSRSSDVEGATAAGMNAVWVHKGDEDPAPALASVHDVNQLPALLADLYGIQV